jgi:Phasin protein
MSERSPRAIVDNADATTNIFLAPALVLGKWTSLFTSAPKRNEQANEGLATIAKEWQDFMRRRLKEDSVLIQRLTHSGTPNQILVAYVDYLQKAAEDYGDEIATMSLLITRVANWMDIIAQAPTRVAGFHSGANLPIELTSRLKQQV